MLIPSIDLMGGRIVQLERGERLILATGDFETWVNRFSRFPIVQLIDLDAAMGRGDNAAIVRDLCARLPCQVGGGVRSIDRAQELLTAGARRVIVGSALFDESGPDLRAAALFAEAVPADRLIAAVDCRQGRVVVNGWTATLPISPEEAARALEPFSGAFLCTIVDNEGTLSGINMAAIRSVAASTSRRVIAAGGIRTPEEVDALHRDGIDAVVGMAIYRTTAFAHAYSAGSSPG
jgi:phosphoribosylformimino-5-aminoimidazole carboxamide ribotide isomerase